MEVPLKVQYQIDCRRFPSHDKLGVYGVKVVNEKYIRVVTSLIILLCVVSRVIAVPVYLRQLGYVNLDRSWDPLFNTASKFFLFASGITGAAVILLKVLQAYRQRRNIQKTLLVVRSPDSEAVRKSARVLV